VTDTGAQQKGLLGRFFGKDTAAGADHTGVAVEPAGSETAVRPDASLVVGYPTP
jgi:hypothetical protein